MELPHRPSSAVLLALALMACAEAPGGVVPSAEVLTAPSSPPIATGSEPGTDPTSPGEPVSLPVQDLPVLFVHGIDGSAADWDTILGHLAGDGWDPDTLYAETFEDPSWGCNVDNAATLGVWVDAILAETGADRIQLVAHSMGTLSTRHWLKELGGTELVHSYTTLGGMHHGLSSSCSPDFPFKPCVWDEICSTGELVTQLNADPATPGDLYWTSIYGTADTVVPNSSSLLDGAENVAVAGVEHSGPNGLQETAATYVVLKEALLQP
jgi:triacylglycerol lipase